MSFPSGRREPLRQSLQQPLVLTQHEVPGALRARQDQNDYGQPLQVALAPLHPHQSWQEQEPHTARVFPKSTCFACSPEEGLLISNPLLSLRGPGLATVLCPEARLGLPWFPGPQAAFSGLPVSKLIFPWPLAWVLPGNLA